MPHVSVTLFPILIKYVITLLHTLTFILYTAKIINVYIE